MNEQPGSGMGHIVVWQSLWWPGTEWCEVQPVGDGWQIRGTVLAALDGAPWQVRYAVSVGGAWTTRDVEISARIGRLERHLRLTASTERIWRIERGPESQQPEDDLSALHGRHDIDLGFSPATNTLPIRRLAPAIGESIEVTAVWLRIPELTIEPLPQRYTRLDARRYRYESSGGAFVAEIEVDAQGVVVSYEGGWQRIAEAS